MENINKLFNWLSVAGGVLGGAVTVFLGGWDSLLQTLVIMVILDYITGVLKASVLKKLSSEIGFKGIVKKVAIFIIIAAAYAIQPIIGLSIREMVIVFFIANEGLSLLENASEMLPIPDAMKKVLLQLREQTKMSKKKPEIKIEHVDDIEEIQDIQEYEDDLQEEGEAMCS